MRRRLEVGGRQGRGNPQARARAALPDALSFIVAAHVLDATPWVLVSPRSPAYDAVRGVRAMLAARVRRLVRAAAAYAAARPWKPWWPGARRLMWGNVQCGCGDCRAYVLDGGEGFSQDGKFYPRQPASWWNAGRPIARRAMA